MTRKNNLVRKILIIILIALSLIFAVLPRYQVYAEPTVINEEDIPDSGNGILGSLLKEVIQLVDAIGDIVMGAFNKFMLGAEGFTSAMLATNDPNLEPGSGSWLTSDIDANKIDFIYGEGTIDTSNILPWSKTKYDIPNLLYAPESIFSNNIAALDVNFLNPNKYTTISSDSSAKKAAVSAAGSDGLRTTIANWYISFRNIAIVGLLTVLIYLGIRIVISSTAVDKAKYKENLQNWLVALCLVFFIHYIMSGLLMITDKFNNLFEQTANEGIIIQSVDPDGGTLTFKTNLIGFVRFNAQSKNSYDVVAYSIMYIVLVIYTCIFTVMYFKRFLYMAFLTMIAPLVALTYPIDKIGDGKAQAFNTWFKEYVTHLILQPVHLILYVSLVSSAIDLVKNNIIYGLVAIGFLIPAEKLIKKMFNLNQAETAGGFGSFAGGALAMQGFNKLASAIGGGKSNKKLSGKGESDNSDSGNPNDSRIRIQDRDFGQSFNNNSEDNNENNGADEALEKYKSEGFGQNANGEYYNPWIDEYDEKYDPTKDKSYNSALDNPQAESQNQISQNDQQNNHWKRKAAKNIAIKGVKKAGKGAFKAAKVGTKALGAAGGATVGLAAGIASGDMSKALTYAGAGALAGSKIGQAAAGLPEKGMQIGTNAAKSIRRSADNLEYEMDKAKYGSAYARQQADAKQNERERIKFMNNKAEKEKYEEMAGRISQSSGHEVSAKELMESAFDYKKAGIVDDKQIENGLSMEAKYSKDKNIHENMIDVVSMTKNYGKDYVLDDKKRTAMQDTIKANVNGTKNQDKVWDLYTETLGLNKLGDKYKMKR